MFSADRLSNLPDVSAISMTHINDTAMTLPDHSRMSVQIDPPDELDRLNLSTYKADMFLDGCKVSNFVYDGETWMHWGQVVDVLHTVFWHGFFLIKNNWLSI